LVVGTVMVTSGVTMNHLAAAQRRVAA